MLTANVEFLSDTKQHLLEIEQHLKQIHHIKVDLLEPLDQQAPALISIDIHRGGEETAHAVAQVLYDALHANAATQGQKQISLVTIEGDRVDIESLDVEQITSVILGAEAGE
ncbi:MAG TPA: hypothetical protein DHW02_00610 [Ktedonobacter sp.]|nr:hypothetical protein [Ktedonobacter sp.]